MNAPVGSPYAEAVYARLLEAVPDAGGGRRLWQVADPYLLRHAAQHAVRASRADDLLLDADFLVEADPDAVSEILSSAGARDARVAARVYRTSYNAHRRLQPYQRRQILALDAARLQAFELGRQLARDSDWDHRWATGQQAATSLNATLEGHTHEVSGVALTALDEQPVAVTSSHGGRVRVWDLATGLTTHTLEGHTGPVTAVSVTAADSRPVAVTSSWDGTARVWDLATGRIVSVQRVLAGPLTGVATTTVEGRPIAVITAYRGTVHVWDLAADLLAQSRPRVFPSAHTAPVTSVAAGVLQDWPVAVTTSYDGTARVWDLANEPHGPGLTLTGHTHWVLGAALTVMDGRPVAITASRDRTVRVWDLINGREETVLVGHTDWVTGAATAVLDGRPVAVTSSRDGTARVWDLSTGRTAATTTVDRSSQWLSGVAVADPADWPVVVTAGERGTVQVWDLSARSTVGGLPGHTNTVTDAATASADGRTLAVTGSRDHTARVWDMTAGTTRTVLEGHRGPITSVAMAVVAGQPVALTGSTDRTARVWDAASGRTTAVFTRHTEPVTGVGLAVLHERPFAVTAAADGTVQVWDVAVRRAVRVIAQEVQAMDVVVVGDRLAAVFATASGADWHPDLGADRAATVPLDRDAPAVTAVAATMLGGLPVAVTGNSEGAVRVWDLSNPREATVIEGHTDGVTDIATLVRGDTTWAITTGYDCTARVWDLANGRCLTTLALPDVPHSVGIGPEGHIVLGMGHEVIALTLTPCGVEALVTTTPVRIVGVHGVGHLDRHRAPNAVRAACAADWASHLASGLKVPVSSFDWDFAYYAPLLRTGPVTQGDSDSEDLDDPLARELMAQWLDVLDAPRPVSQGALTLPLRHAAAWVAEHFSLDGRLTRLFIRVFFREVAAYLRHDSAPARTAAREEVATRVALHRPRIVIAHSLGSVVAYEALHAHPELDVELLLTVGSPLAMPRAVFDRLLPRPEDGPEGRRGERPACVRRWVNIADPGDPVAIPPGLGRAFRGIGLDLTDTVHASYGFHHAKNYLSCAATAAVTGPYAGL